MTRDHEHAWSLGQCTRCGMRRHWAGAKAPCPLPPSQSERLAALREKYEAEGDVDRRPIRRPLRPAPGQPPPAPPPPPPQ